MFRKSTNVLLLFFASITSTGLVFAQSATFQDVQPTGPYAPFYTVIQTALRLGLAVPSFMGTCVNGSNLGGTNPPLIPPPGSSAAGSATVCPYFAPDATVTRAEAAYWIVKSQMDEAQIGTYLCATGGDPSGTTICNGGITSSTFGDLGVAGALITNPFVGVTNSQLMRYIEVMVRRGYTKGCGSTDDPVRRFCPNEPVNRAQLAVFIIRAKMNNVFPTTLSGIPLSEPYGDNFTYPTNAFFTDVTATDSLWGGYFPHVQKLRELNITTGTSPTTYSPGLTVTRKEIAAFAVRAFFF